jgi:hypothetical protein
MPMKMGIHCKPIGHSHSASLDSRVHGNDGGMFFPRKRLSGFRPTNSQRQSRTYANFEGPSQRLDQASACGHLDPVG